MFNHIPSTSSLIWSFEERSSKDRQLFRDDGMIGGLTSVPHRHFDLSGGTDSPYAARHVPNGDKLSHVIFLDVNS